MAESKVMRRRVMQAVKSKDTRPEMRVRKELHKQGYRYRLHKRDLPGVPDLAFPARGKIIFVNGCFWHGHSCKNGARMPKTNVAYWKAKIARNVERDAQQRRQLIKLGWKVLDVWECETKNMERLNGRLVRFLG